VGPSNRSYQAVILRVVRAGEGVEEADPAVVAEHEEGAEEQEDDVHEAGAGRSRRSVSLSVRRSDVMNGAAPATVKTKRIELFVDRQSARPGCQPGRWLAAQIDHGRILANLQLASHPVSPGLVVVIVVFGMGLLAHVAFAIFLILELRRPWRRAELERSVKGSFLAGIREPRRVAS
jgi:hypothetical protein